MSQTSIFYSFPERLQQAIAHRLGWTSLRPVQELSGRALLKGENAVILAPTAGGKTEASMFPALAQLMTSPLEGVGVIYIAPIKALLNNQAERLGAYCEMVGLRRFCWHGDVRRGDKKRFIEEPAELLMTTPESLEVMLLSESMPTRDILGSLRMVIIDEVHALAGDDRGAHLMSVIERLVTLTGADIQRVGLSATVGNPEEILKWISGTSKRAGSVIDPPTKPAPKDLRVQFFDGVAPIATTASRDALGDKSLFFCQSRSLSESIAESMRGRGIDVFVHHSSVSKEERQEAEALFSRGQNVCIVCTSTLELGIDVGDLDRVLQANAPSTVSSFMQRLGRTGRRDGARANTTFYCETPEAVLQSVALIELARVRWVESVQINRRTWPVLVHQLLALTLQQGVIDPDDAWERLSRVPDFSEIRREEYDALIEHMLQTGYLSPSGPEVTMGLEAERAYGKYNFMEIYAVFSSPRRYSVETRKGHKIGSLEQAFVDRQEEGVSAFLLSGRAWHVFSVDHGRRIITVVPSSGGQRPGWGGYTPQLLGFELCQKMKAVLCSDAPISYASKPARAQLGVLRSDLGETLQREGYAIQMEAGRATWWTFAGGQINHTLRYGLQLQTGWKVAADNLKLTIEGDGLSFAELEETISALGLSAFWRDPRNQRRLLAALPEYRLSKFQRALPERFALEVIAKFLLDVPGTVRFLGGDYAPQLKPALESRVKETHTAEEQEEDAREETPAQVEVELVDEPEARARYTTHLPLYKLDAIAASAPAGEFGQGAPEQLVEPEGWLSVDLGKKLNERMFICRIRGHSMDNGLNGLMDGGLAVFELWPRGTRQNKIVLVRGAFDDPETGSYAVKKYVADRRGADGCHQEIRLISLNPDSERYPAICLTPESDEELSVIASLVMALDPEEHCGPPPLSPAELRAQELEAQKNAHVRRLLRVLDRFSEAPCPSASEGPEVQSRDVSWASALVLRSVAEGGLALELSPLQGLVRFIKTIQVEGNGAERMLFASNLRTNRSVTPVEPGAERYRCVPLGFEDDEDVLAVLAPLTVEGLSLSRLTVFRVDAAGLGRKINEHTLSPGQTYRVLVPPSLRVRLSERDTTNAAALEGGWCQLEWTLPDALDAAWSARLKALGLIGNPASISLGWAVAPRKLVVSPRGAPCAMFQAGDEVVVRLTCSAPEVVGPLTFITAHGEETEEAQTTPEATMWFSLGTPSLGLHAIEVFGETGEVATGRLFYEVVESVAFEVVAATATLTIERPGAEPEALEIEADTTRWGDWRSLTEADSLGISAPPCWRVRARWEGAELLTLPSPATNAEGWLDLRPALDVCAPALERAWRGRLVLDLNELGRVRFEHEQEVTPERVAALRGRLKSAWSYVSGALYADAFAMEQWLKEVLNGLGYRLTTLPELPVPEEALTLRALHAFRRAAHDGGVSPEALLVAVPKGSDLASTGKGSLMQALDQSAQETIFDRLMVTDGVHWRMHKKGDLLRRRATNLVAALSHDDAMIFEEFVGTFISGGAS